VTLRLAIVDTSALYAALDADDTDHARCVAVLDDRALRLIVPAMVVAEVSYLAGTRLGADVESTFLAGLSDVDVRAPRAEDWPRIAELVAQYQNLPLGGTDASIVALAEWLDTELVVSLDRRDFMAVRPRHRPALEVLP
jgi:predicted nucleic acid-binding protein